MIQTGFVQCKCYSARTVTFFAGHAELNTAVRKHEKEGGRESVWILLSITAERHIQVASDTRKLLRVGSIFFMRGVLIFKKIFELYQYNSLLPYTVQKYYTCTCSPGNLFTSSVSSGYSQGFLAPSQLFVGICVFTKVMKKIFSIFVKIFFFGRLFKP